MQIQVRVRQKVTITLSPVRSTFESGPAAFVLHVRWPVLLVWYAKHALKKMFPIDMRSHLRFCCGVPQPAPPLCVNSAKSLELQFTYTMEVLGNSECAEIVSFSKFHGLNAPLVMVKFVVAAGA